MKPTIHFDDQFTLVQGEIRTTMRYRGKNISFLDTKAKNIAQSHLELLAEEAKNSMRYLSIHLPNDAETVNWLRKYHALKSDIDQLQHIAQPKQAAFLRKRVAAMPDTKNGKGCKSRMLFLNALIGYYDKHFYRKEPATTNCGGNAGS